MGGEVVYEIRISLEEEELEERPEGVMSLLYMGELAGGPRRIHSGFQN